MPEEESKLELYVGITRTIPQRYVGIGVGKDKYSAQGHLESLLSAQGKLIPEIQMIKAEIQGFRFDVIDIP